MIIFPYVIEFLGTPEAGKTTIVKKIVSNLEKQNYNVGFVRESAEITPRDFEKGSVEGQLWMKFKTFESYLLSLKQDNHFVILDRGVIDSLFFDYLFYLKEELSLEQLCSSISFCKNFNLLPNLIFVFTCSSDEVIKRRGGEGRLVTKNYIENFNSSLFKFCADLSSEIVYIDTTSKSISTVESCVKQVIQQKIRS